MVIQMNQDRVEKLFKQIGPKLKNLKNFLYKNPSQTITEFEDSQSDSDEESNDEANSDGFLSFQTYLPPGKVLQNVIVHQDLSQGQSALLGTVLLQNYTYSSKNTKVQGVRKLYIDIAL